MKRTLQLNTLEEQEDGSIKISTINVDVEQNDKVSDVAKKVFPYAKNAKMYRTMSDIPDNFVDTLDFILENSKDGTIMCINGSTKKMIEYKITKKVRSL